MSETDNGVRETILPSKILAEIELELAEDEEKLQSKLNKTARELLAVRRRRAVLTGHALPILQKHEKSVQLEMPGMPEVTCPHTSWAPNRSGHIACLDCGHELDMEQSSNADETPYRAPEKPGQTDRARSQKPQLDKKTGNRKTREAVPA